MSSEISEGGNGDTLASSFQILSLDGGGIRGLFSAALLAKWEEDLGCTIQNHFDLIVGTSTGGIIALGLGLGMRPREIVEFYLSQGSRIFPNRIPGHRAFRQFFAHKFSAEPLQAALKQCFGDKLLGHSKKRLVIPSYDLGQEEVRVFKTSHHERLRRDFKEPIWKVALATTAAPTYFPACREIENRRLIDGGIWANNPIMTAVTEAVAVLKIPLENLSILSLGTTSDIQSRNDGLDKGGLWQWKRDIAEVLMRAQSVAATGQATLFLGQEKILRVDSIVAKGVFGFDKLTPDKLLAAASHQSLHRAPEIQTRFLSHRTAEFRPCYAL
jgi:patatin-like phospholipase/acyl hydrolase